MTFDHYMKFVTHGVRLEDNSYRERLMLAGMGLGGEAGEVLDEAKKVAFHGTELCRDTLIKELGDVLWYFALMLSNEGLSLDQIMEANVHKITERYPNRHGSARDILEGTAV